MEICFILKMEWRLSFGCRTSHTVWPCISTSRVTVRAMSAIGYELHSELFGQPNMASAAQVLGRGPHADVVDAIVLERDRRCRRDDHGSTERRRGDHHHGRRGGQPGGRRGGCAGVGHGVSEPSPRERPRDLVGEVVVRACGRAGVRVKILLDAIGSASIGSVLQSA